MYALTLTITPLSAIRIWWTTIQYRLRFGWATCLVSPRVSVFVCTSAAVQEGEGKRLRRAWHCGCVQGCEPVASPCSVCTSLLPCYRLCLDTVLCRKMPSASQMYIDCRLWTFSKAVSSTIYSGNWQSWNIELELYFLFTLFSVSKLYNLQESQPTTWQYGDEVMPTFFVLFFYQIWCVILNAIVVLLMHE